jgi:16S rRNA processing protein RimM
VPSSSTDGESYLEIGHIGRAHGLAGEVVVHLVSNVPERLRPGSVLEARDAAGSRAPSQLRVEASRPQGQRTVVRFAGVSTRETAERLRGSTLYGRPIVDTDALFAHDLIGLELVEVSGESHGRVAALQANPASDLLVGEQGWLVPLRFVVERDARRIVVDVPAGMFE